jgi:chromate transporter
MPLSAGVNVENLDSPFVRNGREIAGAFLKLGLTAYGGPAIMGIMQAELQEKRRWVSKERFVEGLALVNTMPGPGAIQLGIFLGYARGGPWGGLLAGLCFMVPAFFIMLALTIGYAAYGATPLLTGALYGLGPVVIGVFIVAVYRLGKSVVTTVSQLIIAIAAAAVVFAQSALGAVTVLALAGGIGLWIFHSRRLGAIILGIVIGSILIARLASAALVPSMPEAAASTQAANLLDIGSFFFIVGAFSFGGGLSMIALIQEQVVQNYHWLTQREFIDGLALGQITPGPILMVSAYVGYKLAGIAGAAIAAIGIFLPSFILMLSILPAFERVRKLIWAKAALRGIGPAVIGVITVSLFRMAPYALPDPLAIALLIGTVVALLAWRIGAIKLVLVGALVGVLRSRLLSVPGIRAIF